MKRAIILFLMTFVLWGCTKQEISTKVTKILDNNKDYVTESFVKNFESCEVEESERTVVSINGSVRIRQTFTCSTTVALFYYSQEGSAKQIILKETAENNDSMPIHEGMLAFMDVLAKGQLPDWTLGTEISEQFDQRYHHESASEWVLEGAPRIECIEAHRQYIISY